jgi:hypothetical protein
MPGWYIHMNAARKAIADLQANPTAAPIFNSDGLDASSISSIARANPTYVALGAIGPDIFFLLPDFKPPVGSMLWKLATTIRELYTAWDDLFLGPYESAIGPISANLNDELNALSGGLKQTIEGIASQGINLLKDFILKLIVEQYDVFGLLSSGVPAGYDEQTFFWSDMLHYRQTYRFGAELWQRANNEPNPVLKERFQAFALGWMSHLATDVTGHAFVNQKVGGPYRLHWQRHHLVENHMDAQVYGHDHGAQPIYQQMANSALHLWLAFNPDGSSRVDFFNPSPNPPYPDGDHSADIVGRHAVWDVDSDLPDELATFIADALKAVFTPDLTKSNKGMVACCPTIISSLDGRVPIESGGYAEKDDIIGAYWWLFEYVKWTTTDYYKIRRPTPPDVFVIPSFPSTPGSGDSDPGPGASGDDSFWDDLLDFLLSLFAWAVWLAEVAIWPLAAIAGIIAGTATYSLRQALYEAIELPLYNLWLGIHTFLAMTGYVMPMPGEINAGLNTLGVSVADNWTATLAALNDPDGGLTPAIVATDPSGTGERAYPKDVLLDPPGVITTLVNTLFSIGPPSVNGELPSEFTRPWRWPGKDDQGNTVNVENPRSMPGSFSIPQNANALFGMSPGSKEARDRFEGANNEAETLRAALDLLPQGKHLGDPVDYTAYVVAMLTRADLDPSTVANFNLDADRGYGYLTWDWLRGAGRLAVPDAFTDEGDPSHGNAETPVSHRAYPPPLKPGYGWDSDDEPNTTTASFDPNNPNDFVTIRYIDREGKFQ